MTCFGRANRKRYRCQRDVLAMLDKIDINTHVLDAGHFEKDRVMYV